MSKPKVPPTSYGYSLWRQYSLKDVHVRYFTYNFKDIPMKVLKDQEESRTEGTREAQKFVYDVDKKELSVTFSGHIQSGIVDALLEMMRDSIKGVPVCDVKTKFHTYTVTKLFRSVGDAQERYRILGDALVTDRSGPVFAIETATRHSYPSIQEKVKKWFLLPSMIGVLVVHLNEGSGYWKPTSRPRDDVFLINSWAWLNYIADLNDEKIDLFDCSNPVSYDGHVWFGTLACAFELYEPHFASKSAHCAVTKRYEFVVSNEEFDLEATQEQEAFQRRFTKVWKEAADGDLLPDFQPIRLDWKRLARCVAKGRLQLAYERYKAWFQKYSKLGTSSVVPAKRQRDEKDTPDYDSGQASCSRHLH